jgi:hypothetical protein
MRKFVWLFAVALLASGGSALAQSACPTDGSCPTDVGACLAESCPCSADHGGRAWKNHGQFVKCVVHLRNDLRKAGCLDDTGKRTIAKCAARSTCGKEGAVLCCVYDTSGTCNDAVPGDGTKAGVCSNAATTACDTATDCITATGPRVSRHPEGCTDNGGTVVGGGSVCSACPIPPPAP